VEKRARSDDSWKKIRRKKKGSEGEKDAFSGKKRGLERYGTLKGRGGTK